MADKDIEALRSPLLLGEDSRRRAPSASGSLRRDVSSRSSIRIANSLRSSENTAYFHDPALPSSAAADDEAEKKGCCGGFCALMDRYPIPFVLGGAAIGVGIGVGLAYWQPENPSAKNVVVQWIGVLGVLFIRALQCIVLPLVFVSVAVAVMDMMALGEAGKVAGFTIGLYIVYTFFAACIGCAMSVAFRQFYVLAGNHAVGIEPEVRLGCDADSYLTKQADGSVACEANGADGNSTLFMLDDVNGYFAKSKAAQGLAQVSLSDSLYEGLFMSFIGPNMFGLFVGGNFLGVIILAAAFGIALTQLSKEMPAGVKWERILIIQVLEELMQVFMMFVKWIIKITPFAIISLIAKAIGGHSDLAGVMEQIGYLVAAVLCGMILQFLVAYIGSYLLIIRKNPLIYFRHMIPAWSVAFASASSAATLPVSIDCAIASGQVPEGVAKFCLPLGATINMDGTCIQIICSCIWLAYYNGVVPKAGDYILLIFCATFGSMGAAPVPSAQLVFILTAYQTTFGGETPDGFAFLVAIDWLLDRFATMFNVAGDLTVTAIVANSVKKDLTLMEKEGDEEDLPGTDDFDNT